MSDARLISYKFRALAILALVPALYFLGRHLYLDDALIYARYVLHALEGRGLVFNVGQPVNALTSILDTWLLLGLSFLLRGHILLAQLILSGSFLLGAALLAESVVPFAGIFIASTSLFYLCNGLETSLFLFLLLLCVRAYVTGRINWLPLLSALAVLTRFEAGALVLVIAWQLWRKRRLPALNSFLPALLLVLLYFAFNLFFYRSLLPQSASAKLGQGLSGYWGRWPTAFLQVPVYVYAPFGESWLNAIALLALAWFGSKDPRSAIDNEVVPPFLFGLAAFYILFNIPGYHWYYAPFVFFLILYACRLLPQARSAWVAASLVALCFAYGSALYVHRASLKATGWRDYAQAGQWLNSNAAHDASVATVETGTIGWYCDRQIIDIVGLTSPRNAHYTAEGDFSSWFAEHADYIVVHPGEPFPWERVALNSPDYERLPVSFGSVSLLRKKK